MTTAKQYAQSPGAVAALSKESGLHRHTVTKYLQGGAVKMRTQGLIEAAAERLTGGHKLYEARRVAEILRDEHAPKMTLPWEA